MSTLRPSQVRTALHHLVEIQRPAFLWGPPGIGKSDVVAQVAKDRNCELRDVRLSTLDATEIKGFPVPDVGRELMRWLPPDFLPTMFVEKEIIVDKDGAELVETTSGKFVYPDDESPYKSKLTPTRTIVKAPNDSKGIIFLDELNQAPPMVQAAAYQLLLNRQVGNYVLPKNWAMLAAGNRETDRSNAQRMPAALALRLVHLDMAPNADDWCAWALEQGNAVPVELLAFLRFRPDLLHNFDPSRRVSPNPRSWFFTGQLTNSGLDAEVEFALMQGTVGEAEASEYKSFLGVWQELPSVEQVKLNPDSTPIPEKPATMFAITAALAHATTKELYPRLKKYVDRMDPEWQIVYTKDAIQRDRTVTTTKEFQQFAVKHSHLLA